MLGAGLFGGAVTGGVGVPGAGAVLGDETAAGGTICVAACVAAGGAMSFDAVLVPSWPGLWPKPNATANTTTRNTAAAIQPHAALGARILGSSWAIVPEQVLRVAGSRN